MPLADLIDCWWRWGYRDMGMFPPTRWQPINRGPVVCMPLFPPLHLLHLRRKVLLVDQKPHRYDLVAHNERRATGAVFRLMSYGRFTPKDLYRPHFSLRQKLVKKIASVDV